MTIKERVVDLEVHVNETYDTYVQLHEDLKKYAGIEINDENIKEVNALLTDIQDTFLELYPFYHFVNYRYPQGLKITQFHNEFIDNLKKNGAKPTEG